MTNTRTITYSAAVAKMLDERQEETGEDIEDIIVAALERLIPYGIEDPSPEERIENAVLAMCETQPSWGARINRVWGALGHDFGDATSLDWGMQRDFHRQFRYDDAAKQAIIDDVEYPPFPKRST